VPAILEVTHLYCVAMKCATDAENLGTSASERSQLLAMHDALLVLADSPSWFCGLSGRTSRRNEAAIQDLRSAVAPG